MTPDDLFNPAEFPDDLKWVAAHHKLHPSDPVYLLLAWHWRRLKQSEDAIKAATLELRATLDGRIGALERAAESAAGVNDTLAALLGILEEKPKEFGARLNTALNQPLAEAVGRLQSLEKTVTPLAAAFATSQRRQILSALILGVSLGVLAALIVLHA